MIHALHAVPAELRAHSEVRDVRSGRVVDAHYKFVGPRRLALPEHLQTRPTQTRKDRQLLTFLSPWLGGEKRT